MYACATLGHFYARWGWLVLLLGCFLSALAASYSIQPDKVDKQKIFYGTPEKFEKPAEVDYDEIVYTTPEFQEIKKKNIARGSGKYWILLSQASDHAIRAIRRVGDETEHDLIALRGYLGSLDPPIPAVDITNLVIESLRQEGKKKTSR